MKKFFDYMFFIILLCFIFINKVNAECTYKERKQLLNLAKNVDVFYEIKEIENKSTGVNSYGEELEYTEVNYEIVFFVSNLSDEIFIKYYNTLNYEEKYINKDNLENGIYTFTDKNYSTLYNYNFEIYSMNENCMGDEIYTRKVVKPIYNGYSNYAICNNEELENYEYCKKFVTKKISLNESEFIELANKKVNSQNNVIEKTTTYTHYYIIIGLVLIILSVTIIIFLSIRRKKNAL